MGKRIPANTQREIIRRRKAGEKYIDIVAVTGVSKSTILKICRRNKIKKPPVHPPLPRRNAEPPAADICQVGRCPKCKRMVEMPCRACAVTPCAPVPLWLERARARLYDFRDCDPIGLELEPDAEIRRQTVQYCHRLEKTPPDTRKLWILRHWLDLLASENSG